MLKEDMIQLTLQADLLNQSLRQLITVLEIATSVQASAARGQKNLSEEVFQSAMTNLHQSQKAYLQTYTDTINRTSETINRERSKGVNLL